MKLSKNFAQMGMQQIPLGLANRSGGGRLDFDINYFQNEKRVPIAPSGRFAATGKTKNLKEGPGVGWRAKSDCQGRTSSRCGVHA